MDDTHKHVADQLARLWPGVADWALAELRETGKARPSVFFLSDRHPSYTIPLGSFGSAGSSNHVVARDMAIANGVLVIGLWIECWITKGEHRYRGLVAHLTARESAKSDRVVVYRGIRLLDWVESTGWSPVEQSGGLCDSDPIEHIGLPLLPRWRPDGSLEGISA